MISLPVHVWLDQRLLEKENLNIFPCFFPLILVMVTHQTHQTTITWQLPTMEAKLSLRHIWACVHISAFFLAKKNWQGAGEHFIPAFHQKNPAALHFVSMTTISWHNHCISTMAFYYLSVRLLFVCLANLLPLMGFSVLVMIISVCHVI